jgi:hypothetical protein
MNVDRVEDSPSMLCFASVLGTCQRSLRRLDIFLDLIESSEYLI